MKPELFYCIRES